MINLVFSDPKFSWDIASGHIATRVISPKPLSIIAKGFDRSKIPATRRIFANLPQIGGWRFPGYKAVNLALALKNVSRVSIGLIIRATLYQHLSLFESLFNRNFLGYKAIWSLRETQRTFNLAPTKIKGFNNFGAYIARPLSKFLYTYPKPANSHGTSHHNRVHSSSALLQYIRITLPATSRDFTYAKASKVRAIPYLGLRNPERIVSRGLKSSRFTFGPLKKEVPYSRYLTLVKPPGDLLALGYMQGLSDRGRPSSKDHSATPGKASVLFDSFGLIINFESSSRDITAVGSSIYLRKEEVYPGKDAGKRDKSPGSIRDHVKKPSSDLPGFAGSKLIPSMISSLSYLKGPYLSGSREAPWLAAYMQISLALGKASLDYRKLHRSISARKEDKSQIIHAFFRKPGDLTSAKAMLSVIKKPEIGLSSSSSSIPLKKYGVLYLPKVTQGIKNISLMKATARSKEDLTDALQPTSRQLLDSRFPRIEYPNIQVQAQRSEEKDYKKIITDSRLSSSIQTIDLHRISDQVCAIIERKLKIEKERRGLYG